MFTTILFAILFLAALVGMAFLWRSLNNWEKEGKAWNAERERRQKEWLENVETIRTLENQKLLAETRAQKQKQELETQVASLEKYRDIVEDTEDFLFEADYKGRFLFANRALLVRLGYREPEMRSISYGNLLAENKVEEVREFYTGQYRNKIPVTYAEWETLNRFGESMRLGVRVRMILDEEGKIVKASGSARDLSDSPVSDKNSGLMSFSLGEFLNGETDPVLVFEVPVSGRASERARLVWGNAAVLQLMGLTLKEVQGLTVEQISNSLAESVNRKLENPKQPVHWKTGKGPDRFFQIQARISGALLVVWLEDVTESERELRTIREERNRFRALLENSGIDNLTLPPLPVIELNFEKVLEITEGDSSFIEKLFNSYFQSLLECQDQFERHLSGGDAAGLKFLLHKIRATIKTFDIRMLDQVLKDSIQRIENQDPPGEEEKRQFVSLVNHICRQVEEELRIFARDRGIRI